VSRSLIVLLPGLSVTSMYAWRNQSTNGFALLNSQTSRLRIFRPGLEQALSKENKPSQQRLASRRSSFPGR